MVSKYSKTKGYKSAHIDQMRLEREKSERIEEEFNAYQCLLRSTQHDPAPGHYRTKNGHHMQIVRVDWTWSRREVSAEGQQLASGYAWVPFPPVARPGAPMTVQQLYMGDAPVYLSVRPQEIGFNDLGESIDQNGAPYRCYQLKQLIVVELAPNMFDYETVTTTVFDPSREHIRVYECGTTFCVAAIPEEFRGYFPVAPVQPQPAPIQQMPEPGLAKPMLELAPAQQMPEPQIFMGGNDSSPSSGSSFSIASAVIVPDNADLANGVSQQDGNAELEMFGLDNIDFNNVDFGNVGDMGLEWNIADGMGDANALWPMFSQAMEGFQGV